MTTFASTRKRPLNIHVTVRHLYRTMTGLWREARPGVQMVFAMRSAAAVGIVRTISSRDVLLPLGWLMLSIAVYVFNGVSDLATDRHNGSSRPLAARQLTPRTATAWSGVLAVLGLLTCFLVSPIDAGIGALFVVLGWAYSAGPQWKQSSLTASAVIGLGAGLTYAAGLVARDVHAPHAYLLPLLLALWVSIASNCKDFSDVFGDAAAGRRTLPVVLGSLRAAWVVGVATIAAGSAAVAVLLTLDPGQDAIGALLAAGSLPLALVALGTSGATEAPVRRRSYRIYMSTQYAVNLAMMAGF